MRRRWLPDLDFVGLGWSLGLRKSLLEQSGIHVVTLDVNMRGRISLLSYIFCKESWEAVYIEHVTNRTVFYRIF